MKIQVSGAILALFLFSVSVWAQDQGAFSGDLEVGTNFFIADEEIGAANTPQYDNQLVGINTWLNLAYAHKGFTVGMRFDMFNNTNLQNPNGSFSGAGIGRWYINKKVNKLDITVGYIYDQIGIGTIFRAYEQRPLFIDNSLRGIRLAYDLGENWTVRAFGGNLKNPLGLNRELENRNLTHGAAIKGAAIDGFVKIKDSKVTLAPGFGVINRTMTNATISDLQTIVSSYLGADKEEVELKYNTYALALYNRLSIGNFSWYIEGAYKTKSTIYDENNEFTGPSGQTSTGQFASYDGTNIYTSLSWAAKGFGVTVEGKRTEHFSFRTDPTLGGIDGMINFLQPMNRENTFRLLARYSPAVQDFGEQAVQLDVRYSPNKKWGFNVNFSNSTTLEDELLYREVFTEITYKKARKYNIRGGLQLVEYNQRIYEGKSDLTENVETVVPYIEVLYKLNRKKSLRLETQYLSSEQDFGSWVFALLEYGIAPHWYFNVSDMYNIDPKKTDKIHYPTVGVVYSNKSNRFTASYVKQVEGIVCAGGVCRLEPAFSGFKLGVTSTF